MQRVLWWSREVREAEKLEAKIFFFSLVKKARKRPFFAFFTLEA
jgi:hypothetical protein